jgi:DNA polymerase-3 subunit delta
MAFSRGKKPADPSFDDLVTGHLKPKQYEPVYALVGEESYRIEQVVSKMRQDILGDQVAGMNYQVFSGEKAPITGVMQQLLSFPMMGGRQLIWLKDAELCLVDAEAEAALERYLENPVASTVFVLSAARLDGRKRWVRLCRERGYLFTIGAPRGSELVGWVNKKARSVGLSISRPALDVLIDLVGEDLQALNAEIDKLALWVEDNPDAVSERLINECVVEQRLGEKFELLNALNADDAKPALRVYLQQTAWGRGAHDLAPLLMWRLRKLALVAALDREGWSSAEVADATAMGPWLLNKHIRPLIASMGAERVTRSLRWARACDASLKRSSRPPNLVFEQTILHICGP